MATGLTSWHRPGACPAAPAPSRRVRGPEKEDMPEPPPGPGGDSGGSRRGLSRQASCGAEASRAARAAGEGAEHTGGPRGRPPPGRAPQSKRHPPRRGRKGPGRAPPAALLGLCPEGSHLQGCPRSLQGSGSAPWTPAALSSAWVPGVSSSRWPLRPHTPLIRLNAPEPTSPLLHLSPETWDRCPNSLLSPNTAPLNHHLEEGSSVPRTLAHARLHLPTPLTWTPNARTGGDER